LNISNVKLIDTAEVLNSNNSLSSVENTISKVFMILGPGDVLSLFIMYEILIQNQKKESLIMGLKIAFLIQV